MLAMLSESRSVAGMTFFLFFSFSALARPPEVGTLPTLNYTPPAPERFILKNGIVVYLLEDHELPRLQARLIMKMSPADEPKNAPGTLDVFGYLWRAGGTRERSPDRLNAELEQMAASVETSAELEFAAISFSCLAKNTKETLDIFTDVLLHPEFRADKLEQVKARALENIRRKNDNPGSIARRALRDAIYGRNHIYARDMTPAMLNKIDRSAIVRLYKTVLWPDTSVLAVSGDFKRDEMLWELEARLGGWKSAKRTVPEFDFAPQNPLPGRIFVVPKSLSQSRIRFGALGIARHDPDQFAMEVANYILGGGETSRLFSEIRSRLGLAYVVGSLYDAPQGKGLVEVGCHTKAGTTIQAVTALEKELKRFSAEPPTREEMSLAKDAILNSFVFRFDSPEHIAHQAANRDFFGYPRDYLEKYPNNIRSLGEADILRVGRTYFDLTKMKMVVVGDQKQFDASLETLGAVTEIPLKDVD